MVMKFEEFKKIPRLSRECVITEKLDGTNGQIYIYSYKLYLNDYGSEATDSYFEHLTSEAIEKIENETDKYNPYLIFAGSKSRWLDISSNGDNYGFAKWAKENSKELIKLGEGRHYGEWWGSGIQRGYGLPKGEKRFSLFNTHKWSEVRPSCCHVVPVLYQGMFDTNKINENLLKLVDIGSFASPRFMNPEGIVIFHQASNYLFKKTITDDQKGKGE